MSIVNIIDMLFQMNFFIIALVLVFILTLTRVVRIVPQGEQWIIERLGKYHSTLESGMNIILPYIDSVAYKVTTKDQQFDIPSQEGITKDNAVVKIGAICFVKVLDPQKAVYGVENYKNSVVSMAVSSLRSVIGGMDLDECLSSREKIKVAVRDSMEEQTNAWGLSVRAVEVQDILPSDSMQASMEEQAAALRSRKATETRAEGNKQAAILEAEGVKQSMILQAEGRQVAAERDAAAKVTLAQATQQANDLLCSTLEKPSGKDALRFQLASSYVEALGKLASSDNAKTVVMPADINSSVNGLISAGLGVSTGADAAK